MKKIISLLCALLLLFGGLVSASSAVSDGSDAAEAEILDSGQCGESLYWELDSEGLLRIFGTGPMYDYNKYYDPSPWYKYRDEPYISEDGTAILDSNGDTYLSTEGYYASNPNGYKVKDILIEEGITYIGDWAFYRVCVDEITVPEGVEATGIFCFRYSPTLKELTLPDSLKVLDDFAISRNYELEVINIGNSLETVGTAGFNNNPSLKQVILPDTCTTINKQLSPTYASIDYKSVGLMENCASLEVVSFGSVTEIPQRTCLDASIKTVIIPNTAKKIGAYAFYNCENLEDVIFEEGSVCTEIATTAFSGCTSLARVKGGVSLEKLGIYTSVSSLVEFDFSSTNKVLDSKQFLGTSLKEVSVSDNIDTIPVACFNSMSSLEKIYLPATLKEIKASSFNHCVSLKDVYFGGTRAQWWDVKKASGWSYKVNSECVIHFADGTSASLFYIPTRYNVTFADSYGNVISEQLIEKGYSATAPEAPEKEGYEFTGWDKDFSAITADTVVTALYNRISDVFTVTFKDFDGTELGSQWVEFGTSATAPADPVRDGYTFTGWDKDFSNITEDTVVTATYSKNSVPAKAGKLRVDVTGGTGFTISLDNGKYRPQGANYTNTRIPVGTTVTVVANDTSGKTFLGWMDEYGAILSLTETYTFTASGNDYLKAAYHTEIEGVNAVVFKNQKASGGNGRILDMQYYEAGDEIIFPMAPSQSGFTFTGWDMTAEDIQAKLLAGEDVTVLATWERAKVYISVTANGGKVSTAAQENGMYLAYGAVTVVANTAEEGQKFAYWADKDGRIMSYDAEYKFFPAVNTELTAVYVAESEAVVREPLAFISADPSNMNEEAILYLFSWDVDESVGTVTAAGLMCINEADYNADTFSHGSGDTNMFDRTFAEIYIKNKNTYSVNKSESFYGNTYLACLFVIYTDAVSGESVTIYSDTIATLKPAL